ncbi:MAG: 50S ribosomal protein L18 [Desulfobacteraceae bacterium]|nr:50S ribosomal protein L18 [Desulfobacteraceae bacterium]
MKNNSEKKQARLKRKKRIRKHLVGVANRPRLSVFRSARHIYAQIIDDDLGVTLVNVSTLDKEFKEKSIGGGDKKQTAAHVGAMIAMRAKAAGISKVAFDRNGYLYHGRVRALAEAARENGLVF